MDMRPVSSAWQVNNQTGYSGGNHLQQQHTPAEIVAAKAAQTNTCIVINEKIAHTITEVVQIAKHCYQETGLPNEDW